MRLFTGRKGDTPAMAPTSSTNWDVERESRQKSRSILLTVIEAAVGRCRSSQLDQDHRTALCAVGASRTGAARGSRFAESGLSCHRLEAPTARRALYLEPSGPGPFVLSPYALEHETGAPNWFPREHFCCILNISVVSFVCDQ